MTDEKGLTYIQLEKKSDMKARGLASPDSGDTLAMSFSVNVQPKPQYVEPDSEFEHWRHRLSIGKGQRV